MVNQKQRARLLNPRPIQSTQFFFQLDRKSSFLQTDRAQLMGQAALASLQPLSGPTVLLLDQLFVFPQLPPLPLPTITAVASCFWLLTHVGFAESPSLAEQLPSLGGSFPISSINIF